MPLIRSKTCSSCGRAFEAIWPIGRDIDDVAAKPSVSSDELDRLFGDLLGSFGRNLPNRTAEPKYSSGALFVLSIENIPEVAEEQPHPRAWVIRYAISPTAAQAGGRFELRIGKIEKGGKELVVQVPPGIRDGTRLRVAGVCPGGEDLLISVEVRQRLPEPGMLGAALGHCPACERRSEQVYREQQVRRERLRAMLPKIGAWVGFGLFILLCLAVWACSR